MEDISFKIIVADSSHKGFTTIIANEMENSAKARGTGIAKRSPAYLETKMEEGKAVIALTSDGTWAGFCYIEAWGHGKFVANSGLIVSPEFRKYGLARKIKREIFKLSRKKIPGIQDFWIDYWCSSNENQLRVRLYSGILFGSYG
ncbi:GNAT family N-acetyltransferase [Algoriphagus boritolerans]|uniref:GNAT family N-acetyltransferase n=1 Tax=Algoriphagus boritolerans TaxID=308111 RepID=UPI002FCDEEDA